MQSDFVKDFVSEMIEEMKIREMRQYQLADKIGMSRAALSRIMRGYLNPSLETIERIADGMGMNPVLCLMDRE